MSDTKTPDAINVGDRIRVPGEFLVTDISDDGWITAELPGQRVDFLPIEVELVRVPTIEQFGKLPLGTVFRLEGENTDPTSNDYVAPRVKLSRTAYSYLKDNATIPYAHDVNHTTHPWQGNVTQRINIIRGGLE